jgi:hypothetical protein
VIDHQESDLRPVLIVFDDGMGHDREKTPSLIPATGESNILVAESILI